MRLTEFGILADENIHPDAIEHLRDLGWDVFAIKESPLAGADDDTLLARATAENRVVLTHDSDFGRLAIAAFTPLVGIVYLRPGHLSPIFTIGTIESLIAEDLDLAPPFIVVAKRTANRVTIRLRTL